MSRAALLPLLFAGLLGACGQSIGDECDSALDCSSQGTRLCDLTQTGGYCTLPGCERGTCPEEAICVLFRPGTPRLATSYCMLECEDDGDCRDGQGYRCLSESSFGLDGAREAEVLDGNKKFCALPATMPAATPGTADAGADLETEDDDAGM